MAEKKTTTAKATAKVAKTVKKTEAADKKVDFKTMSATDIEKFITEKRADQITLAHSHKAGELINPRAITHNRKLIARALTALAAAKKEEK